MAQMMQCSRYDVVDEQLLLALHPHENSRKARYVAIDLIRLRAFS
jgi:hypothetical protein